MNTLEKKFDDLGEGLWIVREDVDDGEIGIGNFMFQRAATVRRKDKENDDGEKERSSHGNCKSESE